MREVVFRGKRADTGSWVTGYLVVLPGRINPGRCFILQKCEMARYEDGVYSFGGFAEVERETVGQYAGIKDALERRVFEGDVLRCWKDEIQVVEWNEAASVLMLHTYIRKPAARRGEKPKIVDGWNDLYDYPIKGSMEVIGNVHDTPGFLEEFLGEE